MKPQRKIFAVFAAFAITLTCLQQSATAQNMNDDMGKDMKIKKDGSKMKMSMEAMKSWPMSSQMAVKEQMDLYGKPAEMTPTMVVWHNNGPWKKTVITNM